MHHTHRKGGVVVLLVLSCVRNSSRIYISIVDLLARELIYFAFPLEQKKLLPPESASLLNLPSWQHPASTQVQKSLCRGLYKEVSNDFSSLISQTFSIQFYLLMIGQVLSVSCQVTGVDENSNENKEDCKNGRSLGTKFNYLETTRKKKYAI